MPKIFGIYPTDKLQSTRFLNKINTYLKRNLTSDWHCYKTKFSDFDHNKCINVAVNSDTKFIFFMGHGRSDCLYGAFAKESNDFISPEAMEDNFNYYKNENFINCDNVHLFKDKIFFSFSCKSNQNHNKSIGRHAINNGVISFVGFGDIVTDYREDIYFPKKAIAIFKGIITKIIKFSIVVSYTQNGTVEHLIDTIKLLTNQEIQKLIISNFKIRHKKIIIEHLYNFKKDIKIFGNRFEKIN